MLLPGVIALCVSTIYKYQQMQMDLHDAMLHIILTITLYTEQHADNDQQVTVVSQLMAAFGHVQRHQVLSTTD